MLISNDALRQQVLRRERGGVSIREMAAICGYLKPFRGGLVGDDSRFARAVGLRPEVGGAIRRRIRPQTAEHICRSLGLDPIDCGI